ncbi:DUF3288 family protein [Pannus brasiliensis CCIBt3594]|uniref:DUF3288 family protein n=1 Tax=Pannus brasiliensis CCIBt3594 TaxID=1427578 RepID=A0AAW9QQD5_9CHRO
MANLQEQQHPQQKPDREVVNSLLKGEPNDMNIAECARLRIRYQGFPGARDIQRDLELVLQNWQITEAELFEKTRLLHAKGHIYRVRQEDQQDWS